MPPKPLFTQPPSTTILTLIHSSPPQYFLQSLFHLRPLPQLLYPFTSATTTMIIIAGTFTDIHYNYAAISSAGAIYCCSLWNKCKQNSQWSRMNGQLDFSPHPAKWPLYFILNELEAIKTPPAPWPLTTSIIFLLLSGIIVSCRSQEGKKTQKRLKGNCCVDATIVVGKTITAYHPHSCHWICGYVDMLIC